MQKNAGPKNSPSTLFHVLMALKRVKTGFQGNFLSLKHMYALILHILKVLNGFYLIRINFRAYKILRICSARKLEIFAHINFRAPLHFQISITCDMAIETENRGQFFENLAGKHFRARNCKNSVLIFAQFRANPAFARKCAKISTRENLYE